MTLAPGREPDHLGPLIFQAVAGYLLHRGWHRDGQDPGIWIDETLGAMLIGDALAAQFAADGVDPLETARVRHVPDLSRVRGVIRDLLHVFYSGPLLSRDEILALGELHLVDAEELGRSGVHLPDRVAT